MPEVLLLHPLLLQVRTKLPRSQPTQLSLQPNLMGAWVGSSVLLLLTECTDSGVDYTQIPKKLDQQFEELDTDSALRPTIIKPGTSWTYKSQKVPQSL